MSIFHEIPSWFLPECVLSQQNASCLLPECISLSPKTHKLSNEPFVARLAAFRLKKLAQLRLVLPLPQSPTGVRTLGGQAVHVSGIPVSKKKMKSTSMNGTISYWLVFMRMHCHHESCKHRKYLSLKFHWLVLHQSNSFSKSRKNSTPGPGFSNVG